MKKILYIVGIVLTLSFISMAQTAQIKQLVFPATGDSLSASVVLKDRVAPFAVWTDSLNTNTTFKFQIGFNYSTTVAPTVFYDVCDVSDTTAYSLNLRTGRVIPIEPRLWSALLGTFSSEQTQVWIRGVLGADQTSGKIVYVRLAKFD